MEEWNVPILIHNAVTLTESSARRHDKYAYSVCPLLVTQYFSIKKLPFLLDNNN